MAWIWASVIFLVTFFWFLKPFFTDRNKKFPPGPIGLPILGHFHLLGKNPHQDLHRLARTYGPIISLRLGLIPAVVVSSPAAAELVLRTHDLAFAGRPRHQASRYLSYDGRNIVFAPYGSYWRSMRKLCTLELLSNQRIGQFRPVRAAELGLFTAALRSAAAEGEIVDVGARVSALNGDMICLMVFGRKFGDTELDERGFKAVVKEALEVAARPNTGDFFPFTAALDLQGLARRMKELSRKFDAFLERIIDDHVERKDEKKPNPDFVDTMVAVLESGDVDFEFDRRHIKAVLMDMMIGAMDTSSATVEWALSELIRHPEVMQKVQDELMRVVGMDRTVEESDLDELAYLNMVIKETLRVHPVVPLLIHEPIQDSMIDGFNVPKGSRVIVNVWSIGKDPSVWRDPEKFIPERFEGTHVDLRGQNFELIPFGSGRRGCPGLQLGLTVVKLILAQLVHCFNWTSVPDGADLNMEEHFGLVVGREKPLMAMPAYRLLH